MEKDVFDEVEQEGTQVDDMTDEEIVETLDETDKEEKEDSSDSSTKSNQKEKKPSHQGEDDDSKDEDKDDSKDDSKEDSKDDSNTDDEKQIPFHKHPRWIAREEKMAAADARADTLAIQNEQLLDKLGKQPEQKQDDTVPTWFQNYFGDDPVAWGEFRKHTYVDQDAIVKRAKEEFQRELDEFQRKQTEQTEKYNSWVTEQVQNLKDQGESFDEEALKKTALKYMPSDEKGNISFPKALELLRMEESQKRTTSDDKKEEKKKIASKTSSKGSSESSKEDFNTTASLRNKSWTTLAEED